ncbi:hypothetical protein J6590_016159 [Homalodisca vitripennis]|nr:hypothetical protein J6590_016159 [Homalodisca vitripennis]
MSNGSNVKLYPGDQKRINSGRRRKVNITTWGDKKRKMSKDSGNPYTSKKKKPVAGKLPPAEILQDKIKFIIPRRPLEDSRGLHENRGNKIPDENRELKMKGPHGRYLPPVKVAAFSNMYESQLPIKAAKKKDLDAMSKFLPPEFVPFYQQLKAEVNNVTGQAPADQ